MRAFDDNTEKTSFSTRLGKRCSVTGCGISDLKYRKRLFGSISK